MGNREGAPQALSDESGKGEEGANKKSETYGKDIAFLAIAALALTNVVQLGEKLKSAPTVAVGSSAEILKGVIEHESYAGPERIRAIHNILNESPEAVQEVLAKIASDSESLQKENNISPEGAAAWQAEAQALARIGDLLDRNFNIVHSSRYITEEQRRDYKEMIRLLNSSSEFEFKLATDEIKIQFRSKE